jgi:hypothetical protein
MLSLDQLTQLGNTWETEHKTMMDNAAQSTVQRAYKLMVVFVSKDQCICVSL